MCLTFLAITFVLVKNSLAFATPKPRFETQIKRAKKQFQDSPEQPAAVEEALNRGIVKPFFHALFLPDPFLNKRRSICEVTSGGVNEKRTLEFDEMGSNLDEAVDDIGDGVRSIIDDGMGAGSIWKYSPFQTDFAVKLVNTDAEMLGHDIECTKLNSIPIKINPRDTSCEILTRPESRGVVSDIFHQFAKESDGGSVAAITGSPGIGKSWTLFHALQQALLYDGANIMFFFQKSDDVVLYLRRNNKIYAWKSTSSTARSSLFKRADVLVLLDPEEARKGGADFKLGEMKLLFAASNNDAHFKNAAAKNNDQLQAFLGPPIDSELRVILKRINPNLTWDVIQKRKKDVGNLIRYLLTEKKYTDRVKATAKAIGDCVPQDEKWLEQALLLDEGMSAGQFTVAGTLFQVLPKRPKRIGYDGQGVKYRERVVLAASDNVRNAIVSANRKV